MAVVDPQPRVLLGIDYGTTFTGLAWYEYDPKTPTAKTVHVFKTWPDPEGPKVPSVLSYSASTSTPRKKQWGYSVDEGSTVLQWTKLELQPRDTVQELAILADLIKGLDSVSELRKNTDISQRNKIPKHITKSTVDVISDYLTKVVRQWADHMDLKGIRTLRHVPLDIVITHPVSWEYDALDKTYRAVMAAFHKARFPTRRDVYFTTEPEACVLYTVQDSLSKLRNTLRNGDCFVLCDAGGGTVDLASYRVENFQPLRLAMVGSATGAATGATAIDRGFIEFLEKKAPHIEVWDKSFDSAGHFILNSTGRLLISRFQAIKHNFDGEKVGDIDLPRKAAEDALKDGIENGVISLYPADIKEMFRKSVDGILDLLERQILQVGASGDGETPTQVTNIFLSGGLSENEYILKTVQDYASGYDIDVQRSNDCWTGVVQGAVLMGLGVGMDLPMKVESTPRHYGVCLSQIFAEWKHTDAVTTQDKYHGSSVVMDRLIWLVRKGSLILPDEPISATCKISCRITPRNLDLGEKVRIIFVASAEPNAPSMLSELPRDKNQVVDILIDPRLIPRRLLGNKMKSAGDRSAYYEVKVDADFLVSEAGVRIEVNFHGTTLADYETTL